MSTKVLTGGGATAPEPIAWRRLPASALMQHPGGLRPEPEAAPGQERQVEALQARVAELEREIAERERQARAAGVAEGQAAALQQAARLEQVVQRFAENIEQLQAARRQFRREAEQDVVRLALAVARRILRRELSVDPEALLGVIKAALEKLEAREVDRLRLNPEDAPLVRRHFEQSGGLRNLEIVSDAHLERGAVILETPRGNLDASLETQLQEVARGLADRVERRS